MYKDTQYGSGTFTLSGGGSVTAQVSGNIYGTGSSCYVSANQTWTLDNNVVTPTLTCSIGTRTETSIASSLTITNNGNATIVSKGIELFTDNACTHKVGTITGDSGTFTGLTANTTYYARAKAYNGTHTGYSSVITTSTYQYPYISAVETAELTIGNSQKLTLFNPLGRSVTIQMYQNPTIYDDSISVFYSGTTSGTSITFTPNASKMYQTIPTETNSTCSYSCKYGSSTKVTANTYKYKVKGNNQEAPNFSNFSFVDGDSSATALTGVTGTNPSIMVKGLSDANFTITTSNKATSNYYAELDYYRFTWTNSTNKNYEASANVTASVTNGSSTTLSVTAYDKRGQNKSVSKTITLISPSNAVASLTTKRRNGIEAVTYLNGTISYWSGDWANGSSRPNQLIKVEMSPNNGTNKYDITSSITSHSSSATSNNVTTLTLATDTIQIHANGSSGGFVVGTAYNLTFYITTGYSSSVLYENSALGGTALVTSGKIGLARFKDSSGNYHYSIGKIPTSNYAFDVLGNTYCEGTLTATGNVTAPQFNGALSGTATNATNTNVTNTNPDSGTWYYPTFVSGTSGNQAHRVNNGFRNHLKKGTTSVVGESYLSIGNATASGTANNEKGFLQIYGQNTGRTQIEYANSTSNVTHILPAKSGKIPVYTSLYDNATGTTGNVTLSETCANFDFIEIFYKKLNTDMCLYTCVYSPNNKQPILYCVFSGTSGFALGVNTETIKISATTISRNVNSRRLNYSLNIPNSGSPAVSVSPTHDANFAIYKVVGWK